MIITPLGIVRNIPATLSQPGHCDALLNLRPEGGGWKVVGEKKRTLEAYTQQAPLLQAHIHSLASQPQLVAIRALPNGRIQLAAAPITNSPMPPAWQELYLYPAGTTTAEALNTHVAFVGNYCCANVPQLLTFRHNGEKYMEEASATSTPPPLTYKVEGRYAEAGTLLTFGVPLTGENLEGCYYREVANGQYTTEALTSTTAQGVSLAQGTNNTPTKWGNMAFAHQEKQELLNAMHGQYQAMQQSTENYREGYVLVCSAWQMADGSYTCASEPLLLHLGCEDLKADFCDHVGEDFDPRVHTDAFFNRDKIAFRQFSASGISTTQPTTATFACQVRRQWMQQLSFFKPKTTASGEKSAYRKAAFFVSPPTSMYRLAEAEFDFLHTIFHYGTSSSTGGLVVGESSKSYFRLALKHAPYHREGLAEFIPQPTDVASWLLYKAVEFDLEDPNEPDQKSVNFGTLTSGEMLKADLAGHFALECAGLLAYNQRLHVWNCTTSMKGVPVASTRLSDVPCGYIFGYSERRIDDYITQREVVTNVQGEPFVRTLGQLHKWPAYTVVARFRIKEGTQHLYHYRTLTSKISFTDSLGYFWRALPRFFSFPDRRCDQLTLYYRNQDQEWMALELPMHPSAGFNFAFCLQLRSTDAVSWARGAYCQMEGGVPVSDAMAERLQQADGQTFGAPITEDNHHPATSGISQPDLLMASAPWNPYVFPPELAFHYGSAVTAASVSTREISSAQTGQYPLAVFTQGGIWCMELGTEAFYRRQVPISEEVNVGARVLPTPYGTAFLTASGVQLLQGRHCKLLSAEAGGPLFGPLWQCVSMQALVQNPTGALSPAAAIAANGGCLNGASPSGTALTPIALGYDPTHHELLVCDPMADASTFCLNLRTGQWYSTSTAFRSFGNTLAVATDGTLRLTAEEEFNGLRPVAVVSRPFTLGSLGYRHIYRVSMQGELKCMAHTYAGLYLFGSNSLGQWRMLSGTQWQHSLAPQVRMPRSKLSWRFFATAFFADVPEGFWLTAVEVRDKR